MSPIVSVTKKDGITTISITDETGTHTQEVLDGVNGTPGTPGADGKTPYFHVKYSNDGGKTFTDNNGEKAGSYIGTYTDHIEKDSNIVSDYTWVKIEGKDGVSPTITVTKENGVVTIVTKDGSHTYTQKILDGVNGTPGANGTNGQTTYFHLKYSNDGGKTFTSNNGEDVGSYIGTYTDFVKEDSDTPSDYTWVKIKGENGKDGKDGIMVRTEKVFLRYIPIIRQTIKHQVYMRIRAVGAKHLLPRTQVLNIYGHIRKPFITMEVVNQHLRTLLERMVKTEKMGLLYHRLKFGIFCYNKILILCINTMDIFI